MVSVCGGIYVIPLYALMQSKSPKSHRARVIASNNVLNALFMVASALITMVFYTLEFSVNEVFLMIALMNIPVFFLTKRITSNR